MAIRLPTFIILTAITHLLAFFKR